MHQQYYLKFSHIRTNDGYDTSMIGCGRRVTCHLFFNQIKPIGKVLKDMSKNCSLCFSCGNFENSIPISKIRNDIFPDWEIEICFILNERYKIASLVLYSESGIPISKINLQFDILNENIFASYPKKDQDLRMIISLAYQFNSNHIIFPILIMYNIASIRSYVKIKELNRGASGSCYLLESDEFSVVYKNINHNLSFKSTGIREIICYITIKYFPSIISVYGYCHNGLFLEYAKNGDLESYLKVGNKLSGTEKTKIIYGLCAAISHIHSHGIVHRDIKPSNIFLDENKEIKLGDFGISRRFDEKDMTKEVGTAGYKAPEVINGGYDYMADVYSIGLIIKFLQKDEIVVDKMEVYLNSILDSNPQNRPIPCEIMDLIKNNMLKFPHTDKEELKKYVEKFDISEDPLEDFEFFKSKCDYYRCGVILMSHGLNDKCIKYFKLSSLDGNIKSLIYLKSFEGKEEEIALDLDFLESMLKESKEIITEPVLFEYFAFYQRYLNIKQPISYFMYLNQIDYKFFWKEISSILYLPMLYLDEYQDNWFAVYHLAQMSMIYRRFGDTNDLLDSECLQNNPDAIIWKVLLNNDINNIELLQKAAKLGSFYAKFLVIIFTSDVNKFEKYNYLKNKKCRLAIDFAAKGRLKYKDLFIKNFNEAVKRGFIDYIVLWAYVENNANEILIDLFPIIKLCATNHKCYMEEYFYSYCLINGIGCEKDEGKGNYYLKRAKKHGLSGFNLKKHNIEFPVKNLHYYIQTVTDKSIKNDENEYLKNLTVLAESGNYFGISRIIEYYMKVGDKEKEIYWHQKSADLGILGSQLVIGKYYMDELKDYNRAEYYFVMATTHNEPVAFILLSALLLKTGKYDSSIYWSNKALRAGITDAADFLGLAYLSIGERERGMQAFKITSDNNFANGSLLLAYEYLKMHDLKNALHFSELSIKQGGKNYAFLIIMHFISENFEKAGSLVNDALTHAISFFITELHIMYYIFKISEMDEFLELTAAKGAELGDETFIEIYNDKENSDVSKGNDDYIYENRNHWMIKNVLEIILESWAE